MSMKIDDSILDGFPADTKFEKTLIDGRASILPVNFNKDFRVTYKPRHKYDIRWWVYYPEEELFKIYVHEYKKIMYPPGIYVVSTNNFISNKQFADTDTLKKGELTHFFVVKKNHKNENITENDLIHYNEIYIKEFKAPVYETFNHMINRDPYPLSYIMLTYFNKSMDYTNMCTKYFDRRYINLMENGWYDTETDRFFSIKQFNEYYKDICYLSDKSKKLKSFITECNSLKNKEHVLLNRNKRNFFKDYDYLNSYDSVFDTPKEIYEFFSKYKKSDTTFVIQDEYKYDTQSISSS